MSLAKRIEYVSLAAITLLLILVTSCGDTGPEAGTLPVLGLIEVSEVGDTVYHTIPDFALLDQDSSLITQETVAGKIWVSDFFFTSCPTICPKMSQQMIRLHDAFIDEPGVVLLSHSIDPEYDTVPVLKAYSDALEINPAKWHLMTGEQDEMYELAEAYMVSAAEDPNAPGGFIHSGGVYPGGSPAQSTRIL